jgi:hypothetical protein
MSLAVHGNYCGPGWTAGKYMDAKDATEDDFKVKPVDQADRICQYHDFAIWRAYQESDPERQVDMLIQADRVFENDMKRLENPSFKTLMMAKAVRGAGPAAQHRQKLRHDGTSLFNLHHGARKESKRRTA